MGKTAKDGGKPKTAPRYDSRGRLIPGGTKFGPGNRANPGGRPKAYKAFKARCQEFMDAEGWNELVGMAKDRDCKDRFNAIRLLAAYAVGNPGPGQEAPQPSEPITIRLVDATRSSADADD